MIEREGFREGLKGELLSALEPCDWIRTVWEGGSAATGRLDRFSDLDLVMVVEDERVPSAFTLIEEKLKEGYGIRRTVVVPEPAWHGHSQRFYFIEGAPALFYIDLLVEKLSAG
jgi:predicted nucleotidyltransferase